MAILHFRSQIIGGHRSAVAAAAYRHRTAMRDDIDARVWAYAPDPHLVHTEIVLPSDAPEWLIKARRDYSTAQLSERLWNAAHAVEVRRDAQIAREFIIAMPVELTRAQNIQLMREYVVAEIAGRGFVADWVFHDVPDNPHVHLMHTVRPAVADGFGKKAVAMRSDTGGLLKTEDGKVRYRRFLGTKEDFKALRVAWVDHANRALALADRPERLDARSYADQGADILPNRHLGPALASIKRQGLGSPALFELTADAESRSRVVSAQPEIILALVANAKATFTRTDLAKSLHLFVDDPEAFTGALARLLESPQLVVLTPASATSNGETVYAARTQIERERALLDLVPALADKAHRRVTQRQIEQGFAAAERRLAAGSRLSNEQRAAAQYLARSSSVAVVVGLAGTGKSTLLDAARATWEASGVSVHGAALAGIAARGLETSSGIPSRTIASWFASWDKGIHPLKSGDVLVVDEAGMIGTADMLRLVQTVAIAGAKLVLVGDPAQLQPVAAGAPFRQIIALTGHANLETVLRQRDAVQRVATLALARGKIGVAVKIYQRAGAVQMLETTDQAVSELTQAFVADMQANPNSPPLALAPTNALVQRLNLNIRSALIDAGSLAPGYPFATAHGPRAFAIGDRMICLATAKVAIQCRAVQIDNGTQARVIEAASNWVRLALADGTQVDLTPTTYPHLDHGYAITIHKAQGVTVDRAYVLATRQLDRSMAYVAMSRHRHGLGLFVAQSALDGSLIDSLSRQPDLQNVLSVPDWYAVARGLPSLDDLAARAAGALANMRARLASAWERLNTAVTRVLSAVVPVSITKPKAAQESLLQAGVPPVAAAEAAAELAALLTHRLPPEGLANAMTPPQVRASLVGRVAHVVKIASGIALVQEAREATRLACHDTERLAVAAWRHTAVEVTHTNIILRCARHVRVAALAQAAGFEVSPDLNSYRKPITVESQNAALHDLVALRRSIEDVFDAVARVAEHAAAVAQAVRIGITNLGVTSREGWLVMRAPHDGVTGRALVQLGAQEVIKGDNLIYALQAPKPSGVATLAAALREISKDAQPPKTTGTRTKIFERGAVRLLQDGDMLYIATPRLPRTAELTSSLNPSYRPDDLIAVRGDVTGNAHLDATLDGLAQYHASLRVPPTTDRPGLDLDQKTVARILSTRPVVAAPPENAALLANTVEMIQNYFGSINNIAASPAGRELPADIRDDVTRVMAHITKIAPEYTRAATYAQNYGYER